MIKIQDPSDVKEIRLILHEINQDLKNLSDHYIINNGIFYSFSGVLYKCRTKVNLPERILKKNPNLENIFRQLNGYINGIEFYTFIENFKNNFESFEFYKDYFIINTNLPEVKFSSKRKQDGKEDYTKCKNLLSKFKKEIYKDNYEYSSYQELKNSKNSHIYNFNLQNKKINLILIANLFIGFKASSNCEISIMETDLTKNNIYCASLTIKTGKHINQLFYPFVNF